MVRIVFKETLNDEETKWLEDISKAEPDQSGKLLEPPPKSFWDRD